MTSIDPIGEYHSEYQTEASVMNTTHFPANDSSKISYSHPLLVSIGTYLVVYVQPVLCVTGILGNFVSVLVFLSKHLRKASSNIYLTALSVASVVFCTSMFIFWLDDINVKAATKPVLCQTFVFLTYTSSFLTVWFVVCITFENYIVTVHTQRAVSICTVTKARTTVSILSTIAVLLYSFALWTTKSEGGSCQTGLEYRGLVENLTYVDTMATLIIPSITMMFFIGSIFINHLCFNDKRTSSCRKKSGNGDRLIRGSRKDESLLKITRVLLAISLSYVVFGAPMYINKIRVIILSFHGMMLHTRQEMAIHHICLMIYYTTFTLNFIYYLKWSLNYRRGLSNLLLHHRKPNCDVETKVISVPLIQMFKKSESKEQDVSVV